MAAAFAMRGSPSGGEDDCPPPRVGAYVRINEDVEEYDDVEDEVGTSEHQISVEEWPDENPPVVSYNLLTRSIGGAGSRGGGEGRTLGTFFGVFMPCVLSMFSLVIFLRVGIAVGQCGIYVSLLVLVLCYFIIEMTILSICAISTNGNVEAGGAYFMISRALGPEFGGALGLLFYVGNVFSCASYVISVVEAVTDSFGLQSGTLDHLVPQTYWWRLLYATIVLLLAFSICIVGSSIYAKSTFFIFIVVNAVLATVFASFFIEHEEKEVPLPAESQKLYNTSTATYTGLSYDTWLSNSHIHYSKDYTNPDSTFSFVSVFAIVFNGCTGIMAGANMSGELKSPSRSIPKGTVLATVYSFSVYASLYVLSAASCSTLLLQANYTYLQTINLYPPLVFLGTVCVTLSSALSTLIGGSRVLFAVAKDDILGRVLSPIKSGVSQRGNPYLSVIVTAVLVQCILFIGNVNQIAPIVSIFYLLVYFSINLACASLDIAAAPNFRPQFKYFSKPTCFLGMAGALLMIFLISALYASAAGFILLVLILVISVVGPERSWGSISQALMFFLVRKFLLKLDQRKDHVKFWRPQILLLVNNPRSCIPLMHFCNDIKKSGLYIIGHVLMECERESRGVFSGDGRGRLVDESQADPVPALLDHWMCLVDTMRIKAFVEITDYTSDFRRGVASLVRHSGLGGMKPNTIVLGFLDEGACEDMFVKYAMLPAPRRGSMRAAAAAGGIPGRRGSSRMTMSTVADRFPRLPGAGSKRQVDRACYVQLIKDLIFMRRNVVLAANFNRLDLAALSSPKKSASGAEDTPVFIDIWPFNFSQPDSLFLMDIGSIFMLQFGTVLHMKGVWKSHMKLRIFAAAAADAESEEERVSPALKALLDQLRIEAQIVAVDWNTVRRRFRKLSSGPDPRDPSGEVTLPDSYYASCNALVRSHSQRTVVSFLYLPAPPDNCCPDRYMQQLTILLDRLPPTCLVHGVSPVTCLGL